MSSTLHHALGFEEAVKLYAQGGSLASYDEDTMKWEKVGCSGKLCPFGKRPKEISMITAPKTERIKPEEINCPECGSPLADDTEVQRLQAEAHDGAVQSIRDRQAKQIDRDESAALEKSVKKSIKNKVSEEEAGEEVRRIRAKFDGHRSFLTEVLESREGATRA